MLEEPPRRHDADPDRIGSRQEFADELTLLRERSGLTVRDVARALAVPASTVGGYYAGRYLPPPRLLRKILQCHGVEDAAAGKWLVALQRVRRAPGRRPATAPVPYRGLASFQVEEAGWFYGREKLIDVLAGHVRRLYDTGGVLAVVGPSGSGKSSLVRAGLIPALRSGAVGTADSAAWPVLLLTPGASPVRELAAKLASLTGAGPDRLIVVDQFEEVFTACQDERERLAFVAALQSAAGRGAVVVVSLRADFYAQALRYPALASALQDGQVLVGPLNEAELRSVITGPASKARLDVEEGLVEVLLRDLVPAAHDGVAAHDPGALPLLSHALLTTWERSRRGKMTVADYHATGGIRGAVAGTAEEVYRDLTPAQQDMARQIFIRLVHVADDTADTRRRVPRPELLLSHGDAQPVLDAFIAKRLITAQTDDVEIVHEALLLAWPRLREWIDYDRAGVRVHRQLTAAADMWQEARRDPGALYRGNRLATAEDWATQPAHASDLNVLEREFLDASVERRVAEDRTARRRTRRLQRLTGALAAVTVIAGVLTVVTYREKDAATYQRDLAISRQVATEANQLRTTDIALAMQLSLAAYRISPTAEARSSLLESTASMPVTRMLGPAGTEMAALALNPGKTVLAVGGTDGIVQLWDVRGYPRQAGRALSVPGSVTSAAFSPDGKILAVGSSGGVVRLWQLRNPERSVVLAQISLKLPGAANSVAFSPDGQILAAAGSDGRVWLWNVAGKVSPRGGPLDAGAGPVSSVAFSPDGAMLAAGGSAGQIRLWKLTGPEGSGTVLAGPANGVNTLAFSPDGRTLAAGGNDSQVWLWSIGPRISRRPPLTGPRSWIYSVAFSPSGNTLAAGSADNNAYVWNLPGGTLAATLPHPAPVLSVAYGPGASTLATADADGVTRMWTLPGPVMTGPPGSVFTVAFGPESDDLVLASAIANGPGFVQLWDTADPGQPAALSPPIESASLDGTVAYGPGGRLAAGGANGSVQLWNVTDPRHPVPLPPPPTALDSAVQYVAFDGSGRLMAAGSTNGGIEIWNTADFARTESLAVLPGTTASPGYHDVFAVAFSPGDHLLAAAGADGTVRLWDIADPGHPRPFGPPVIRLAGAVYQVTFSPDGKLLAASGADGKVRLWDVTDPRRPRLLSTLSGPKGIVYDVAFSPDGHTLATADGDKTVTLWSIADPSRPGSLGSLTGPSGTVFSVAFSPSGNILAAGSQDDTTRLWQATTAAAARYVCSITGSPITQAEWAQYIPGLPYNPPCA
jgi:WD40 repeat protein